MAYKKIDVVDAEAELNKQRRHPYLYSAHWIAKALLWGEFSAAGSLAANTWRIFAVRLRSDLDAMLWAVK
jgi:hypothetical protein